MQDWQCPWCKNIINNKRERIKPASEIFPNNLHRICNICRDKLEEERRRKEEENN